jgi:YHS domain-containing protein
MFRFLAELIVFVIAVSVIRSVVSYVQRAFMGGRMPSARVPGGAQGSTHGATHGSNPGAGATILQQDPVCGTYVAIDSSLKRVVNGQVLHFCSVECRDKYIS